MPQPDRHRASRALLRFVLGALSLAVFLVIGCRSFDLGFNISPRFDPRADLTSTGPRSVAPTKFTHRGQQTIFFSDFDLQQEKGLLEDLGRLRDRVARGLELPPSNAVIQVFVFDDRERYTTYLNQHHKNLPTRRALFVRQQRVIGSREDLLIYTYRTERLAQDLRHESTHALLHSSLREVPLWLDEGLAEYFELPVDLKGINAEHVRLLRHGPMTQKADLARLESLKDVPDMTPAEYREAWAWVHLMLNGKPEGRKLLLAYLQQLRETPNPGPLLPRLTAIYPDPVAAFQEHIGRLDAELARTTSRR